MNEYEAEKLLAVVEYAERLSKLTNEELLDHVLESGAANFTCTIELLNRLCPGWADEKTKNNEPAK